MKTKLFFTTIFAFVFIIKGYSQTDTNIIITDLNPDVYIWHTNYLQSHTDSFKIDINDDDTLDIKFYFLNTKYSMHYIAPLNAKCFFAFFDPSNNDSLSSSQIHWYSYPFQWLIPLVDSVRLGIKFVNGNDVYYGWVRALTKNEGPYIKSYTIDKYAYCKMPNYPLLWGQTEITTSIPDEKMCTTGIVTISLNNDQVLINSKNVIQNVTVTGITGTEVLTKTGINSKSAEINIGNIAHGTYIVRIEHKDGTVYTKQIVR